MKTRFIQIFVLLIFSIQYNIAQEIESLDSITIKSSRIDLPFKMSSRTISIITIEDIKNSPATNLVELLQQEAGVDIRRQGVYGMQSDLYKRWWV